MSTEANYKPLEAGEYLVELGSIKEKTTKKGDPMLTLTYQVKRKVGEEAGTPSKAKGRLIFDNLILSHANPKVEEITRERASKFLKSVGVDDGIDGIGGDYSKLKEYIEMPFIAKVKVEAGTNGYPDSNKVTSFKRR
jgi:hypothetical protein